MDVTTGDTHNDNNYTYEGHATMTMTGDKDLPSGVFLGVGWGEWWPRLNNTYVIMPSQNTGDR